MVEILISGGTVVTMDPGRRFIKEGTVAIDSSRIVDVGSTKDLKAKHVAARAGGGQSRNRRSWLKGLLVYMDRYWGRIRY